jgi:heptosyltransferase-1
MHLAAAVGTPVVALFGPTAPWRTGPYGQGHVVLRAGVSCSPCFSRSCKTAEFEPMACMNRITVEQVVEAVVRLQAKETSKAGRMGRP